MLQSCNAIDDTPAINSLLDIAAPRYQHVVTVPTAAWRSQLASSAEGTAATFWHCLETCTCYTKTLQKSLCFVGVHVLRSA